MAKKYISPHDRYVRSSLTIPQVAKDFFAAHLPASILSSLDLSTLEPQKESFIDDNLKLGIADLLYSVKFHEEQGYLYLLLEHASTADKLLAFRLLKYSFGIMDFHLKKTGGTKLPFIYPMVLYTGNKPYPYSTDLFELFGQEKELARQTFLSPYQLIGLTQVSDEELSQSLWFGIAALVTKHIHDPDILPVFKNNVIYLLREIEKQGEFSYIYTTLSYIVEAGEIKDPDEFIKTIQAGLSEIEEEKVQHYAQSVLDYLDSIPEETQATVPSLWFVEVVNVLRIAEKKDQISDAKSLHFLDLLSNLPINVDTQPFDPKDVLMIARSYQLTSYDAVYLLLALRNSVPLATRDTALREAAQKANISLLFL